jgi:hypothetical protein
MDEVPEFAEEYTFRERVWLMVCGLVSGGLVILAWKLWLLPEFRAFVPTAPCRLILGVNGRTFLLYSLFVGLPLLGFLVLAATEGRRGLRMVRGSRFPPAGEKVLRRTRIRRGAAARRIGYFQMCMSIPFIALAIWGCFQAHSLAREMHPRPTACIATADPLDDHPSPLVAVPAPIRRIAAVLPCRQVA